MNQAEKRAMFAVWLKQELEKRGWVTADLAKAAGMPHASVSELILEKRNVGLNAAEKLAKGLGVPLESVLMAAGRMEKVNPRSEEEVQILYDIQDMPDHYLPLVRDFIHSLIRRSPPPPAEKNTQRKDKKGRVGT